VKTLCQVMLAATTLPVLLGADWPQWRGPNRDGKSPETGILAEWPAGGPPLAFSARGLGSGFASVAVVGGRVYTLGDHGGEQLALALDGKSGAVIWKTKIGPAWKDEYGGPRSTPTVDGERLYVLGTEGDLVCLRSGTGEVVWKRSLPGDFGGLLMKAGGDTDWKFAESPLVDGERVIVTPGAAGAMMVALDKATGKELWRTSAAALGPRGVDGAGYASAVVTTAAGVRQVVQLVGRGAIGVDAATGKLLWSYNKIANDVANIPTPLVRGHHVFVSTGYGTGAELLRLLEAVGDGVKAEEVYFLPAEKAQNHHGNMILHEGHVYMGTAHNKGLPLALELATGNAAWGPERNAGKGSAALAFADGRLYFRYESGLMLLVEATPEAYRERGSFTIPGVEHPSWAHPVIAGGRLWLREQDALHVYDLKEPPA
jgi:outer membrane protein assembly factor BamB